MREQRERRGAARDERAREIRNSDKEENAIREDKQKIDANKVIEEPVDAHPRHSRGLALRTLWSRPVAVLLGGIDTGVLREVVLCRVLQDLSVLPRERRT